MYFRDDIRDGYMRRVLVIYHKEDNDGACSAGIVKAFLNLFMSPYITCSVDFLGADYADLDKLWSETEFWLNSPVGSVFDCPEMGRFKDKYDTLFLVDLSFDNPKAMLFLHDMFRERFVWCDHHASAISASNSYAYSNATGIRRADRSALMNVFDFMTDYFGSKYVMYPSEELVKLSDWDSWAWQTSKKSEYAEESERENLQNLNVGITNKSSLDPEWFFAWVSMWLNGKSGIDPEQTEGHTKIAAGAAEFGKIVREIDAKRQTAAITKSVDRSWKLKTGEVVGTIFTTEHINSKAFDRINDPSVKHWAVIQRNNKNNCWTVGLYNTDETDPFDCGDYMKKYYNGGGHHGAAGCSVDDTNLAMMMMNKVI